MLLTHLLSAHGGREELHSSPIVGPPVPTDPSKASRALGFEAEHADLLASSALAPLELFLVQHVEIQPLIFPLQKINVI